MTLLEYRKKNALSVQALADLLGLSIGHTSDLLNQKRGCSLAVALRVEEITNGKVRCKDLLASDAA